MKIGLNALVFCLTLASCTASHRDDNVALSLVALDKLSSNDLEQDFNIELKLTNPTNTELKITTLRYAISLDGYTLIQGAERIQQTIAPQSELAFSTQAKAPLADSLRFFNSLAANQKPQVTYQVTAHILLDSWWHHSLTLEQDGRVNIPQ